MQLRHVRRARRGRKRRKVLLVGLPPLTLTALEPALAEAAEVHSVPFPGTAFDRAVEEFDADLVVVDVTYLDESLVRPLITRRFLRTKPAVVFVSEDGEAWLDDLRTQQSRRLVDAGVQALVTLASGSPLKVVAEQ
jgi:hypothetical protein